MFSGKETALADMFRILILTGFAVSAAVSGFVGAIYFRKIFKDPKDPHTLQPLHVVMLSLREVILFLSKIGLVVYMWNKPFQTFTIPFAVASMMGAIGLVVIARFVSQQGERVVEVDMGDDHSRLADRASEDPPWTGEERRKSGVES